MAPETEGPIMIRAAVCLSALLITTSAVVAAPEDDLAALAKQLKHKDVKTRLKAAEALRDKGKEAAPVAREICDALLDPSAQVVGACLATLKEINPELYKPINVLVTEQGYTRNGGSVSVNPNWDDAIEDLKKIGEDARPAMGVVIAKVRQEFGSGYADDSTRMNDFGKAIVAIAPEDPASIEFLKVAVTTTTKYPNFRLQCFAALGKWAVKDEKRDKQFLPILRANLFGKDAFTHTAIGIAYKLGPRAKSVLPELKKLKNSTDEEIRAAATEAVKKVEE